MPRVGVLSLQGDFALHAGILTGLGVEVASVRRQSELSTCDALVLPGGETTTLTRILDAEDLREPLAEFVHTHPVLGTCAGCILLASRLEDAGGVVPLARLDITVRRNGFGRQIDSFEAPILLEGDADTPVERMSTAAAFIRAPRILEVGAAAQVWGRFSGEVVAVRQRDAVALTFHPEVTGDPSWHRDWLTRAGLLSAAREGGGSLDDAAAAL